MRKGFWDFHLILFKNTEFDIITVSIQESSEIIFFLYYERCSSSWFEMIAELIVCLTIESHRCGSRRFDRYTAGLRQAMVSTEYVTV